MGTYRESALGSFLFGRCKRSSSLCMIVFHDGDRNQNKQSGTVTVYPEGVAKDYRFKDYKETTFIDEDGNQGEEIDFTLAK